MRKENELMEQKELREEVIGRVEVLDKVGELLLLPNTEYATTKQVAEYYKVGNEAISSVIKRNKKELESNGLKTLKRNEIDKVFESSNWTFKTMRGKTVVKNDNNEINVTNTGLILFSKRTILNVGMLLEQSEVAKEVRTKLLDVIHDTEKEHPEIVENVLNEINEEKELMLSRIEAEMNGDFDQVCVINAKLFALKNKRIKELEDENKTITTHALTLIESRSIINKIVRHIAMTEYHGAFARAWNKLYSQINYKLGINIKGRDKKKNQSYLDTLSEEETFEVEKVVRNWAVKLKINVEEILKLA